MPNKNFARGLGSWNLSPGKRTADWLLDLVLLSVVGFGVLSQPAFGAIVSATPESRSSAKGPSTTDAEVLESLNLDFAGMNAVKAAAATGDLVAVENAYLDYRRHASTAKWSVMPADMPRHANSSEDAVGNEILRHHIRNFFYPFSPREADMGKDFDWTFNPINPKNQEYSFEWTYCAISRTQFWEKLVDAYWKTHNEKYAREWVNELEDFAIKNPRASAGSDGSVSLWRTLDGSIRMSESWPYTYSHVLDSPSFTPHAEWTYLKLIRDHAILLENGLKHADRTGNWVSSECFGLYTLATLFPELKDSPRWRELAETRMLRELNRMVPPDGFEAELTPNYHMVSLDGFLGVLKLAKLNKIETSTAFQSKIISMYRALVMVMAQDGSVVPTNDSQVLNAIDAARQGLKLAPDPLLEWAASGGARGTGLRDSTMLPYAGFYAMRGGWKPNDMFLFFRAGPPGIGHEHQDMLEVVLRRWGKTLLLDPGNALYDHSDFRRFVIGTDAHNTITVDGKWQHRAPDKAPVVDRVKGPWVTTPLFDFTSGTYRDGYQKSVFDPTQEYQPETWKGEKDRSVSHTRRVLYLRPYYAMLLDTVDGTGVHEVDSHFNVGAPSVRIDKKRQAAFSENEDGAQIALYPMDRENLNVRVIQGEHGAADIKWAVPTVEFSKKQEAPAVFGTFLYPYRRIEPDFSATALDLAQPGAWGKSIHTSQEDAEIVIGKGGEAMPLSLQSALRSTTIDATAGGLVVRRPRGGHRVLVGAWDLTTYRDNELQLRTSTPGSFVIVQQPDRRAIMNAGSAPVTITLERPAAATFTLAPSSAVSVDATGTHPIEDLSEFRMPEEVDLSGVVSTH